MTKTCLQLLFVVILIILFTPLLVRAQQQGPANVPRSLCDPSIHEGPSGRQSAGFRNVNPVLGLLPASYDWVGGVLRALGSALQPLAGDPKYLGYKSGQQVGYDFRPIGFKQSVSRLDPGYKRIGGKNVTDVPQLGRPERGCPGDPAWVKFPRPGNVEFPPPFQPPADSWDCFCRVGYNGNLDEERVACPTGVAPPLGLPIDRPGPNLHRVYGGRAGFIPCSQCFGIQNIRGHDPFVGRPQGPHFGYSTTGFRNNPVSSNDPGYQECLRQSVESYAGSGPGGQPQVPDLYGL